MFVKVLADNAYSQCRRARVVMVDYFVGHIILFRFIIAPYPPPAPSERTDVVFIV